jgi:hypothetical protein
MSHRELFARSCNEAANYPKNLVYPIAYDHFLTACVERLDEQEKRLFFDESKASLSIRDYEASVDGTFLCFVRGCGLGFSTHFRY